MSEFRIIPPTALTDADYRQAMTGRTRPLTDNGIGDATSSKRRTDAELSALHPTTDYSLAETVATLIERRRRRQTECGTLDGYATHLENGTDICKPCRAAHRKGTLR